MNQPPAGPPTRHGYRNEQARDGYDADDQTSDNGRAPARGIRQPVPGHFVPPVEDDPDLTRMAPRSESAAGDSTRGRPGANGHHGRPTQQGSAGQQGIVNGSAPINGSAQLGGAVDPAPVNGRGPAAGTELGGAMRRITGAQPLGDEDVTVRRQPSRQHPVAPPSAPPQGPGPFPAPQSRTPQPQPQPPGRGIPAHLDETAPAPAGLDRGSASEVGSAWFSPDRGRSTRQSAPDAPAAPAPVAPQAPATSAPGVLASAVPHPSAEDATWAPPGPAQQAAEPRWEARHDHRAPAQPGAAHANEFDQGAEDGDAKPTTLDRVASAVDWMRGKEKASEAKRKAKEARRSPRQRTLALIRELTIVVVIGVAVTLLLRAFVLQPFGIPSESMQNTLMTDDKVVVSKITDYHRGDILVFRDDHGWLPPAERTGIEQTMINLHLMPDAQYLTKRLIGLPGDRVQFDPTVGRLTVNGYPLEESDYLYSDSSGQPVASVKFEVVVPAGHVFMMGDNRSNSADSRCHLTQADESGVPGSMAFIDTDAIVGPVSAIYLPFNRIQTFDTPRTFAGVPDPTQVAPKDPVVVGSEMC